ncbi:bacillithiol biosynthesis deacetylase BshB1 [Belliella sp. DSM 111904]|uniref:Bacillithiol biosynthesis deacetylase BshB1 n=1 Tax=Belliella filtrata TaxID=2923435 RepID=A0ABS9UWI3_9BACT|nr:bacillithiol biosynthesis deacetylase BshB1 [Belliella filtrata]MCH7408532.1 bacillithiol biosynthesis deacetylase BshB1 [Belliella filtrata]
MKLDILVLAAHPDDAELACSGTIASAIARGKKVGIVDFTQGELGTRGTPEIRLREANDAAKILSLSARENLGFKDILFTDDTAHQLEIVKMIRKYQPEIILANAISDRHPDHAKGGEVASKACFVSGLRKVETSLNGQQQTPWRPKFVYHYIQNNYIQPDFVVDISDYWSTKMASIKAYKSQFFDPENKEPESFISSKNFLDFVEARAREFGHSINVTFGEGFTKERMIGIDDLFDLK